MEVLNPFKKNREKFGRVCQIGMLFVLWIYTLWLLFGFLYSIPSYKQRKMITFCFLYAQGGCKPQAIAHAKANIRLGNDQDFLIKIVSQNVPFVGYPRSINAIDCIEKAGKE